MKRFFSLGNKKISPTMAPTIFSTIASGDIRGFEELIAEGVDLNVQKDGASPLRYLVSHKHSQYGLTKEAATRMAQILIERGADIYDINSQNNSKSLLELAVGGDIYYGVVETIIAINPSIVNEVLRLALQLNKADMVELAFENGANIEELNEITPIVNYLVHYVAGLDVKMSQVLFKGGVDFGMKIRVNDSRSVMSVVIEKFLNEDNLQKIDEIKTFAATMSNYLSPEKVKNIIASDQDALNKSLTLGLKWRNNDWVDSAILEGAIIDRNSERHVNPLISKAIVNQDIEAIKLMAKAGFSFNAKISDLPILMFAIKSFAEEKDPDEIVKIKTFITEAAKIMFDAGANIKSQEGGAQVVGTNGAILSSHASLAKYALQHEYSCDIAKMIVERGGREEIDEVMIQALRKSDINLLKRAIAAGANVIGEEGISESPLTYASRNAPYHPEGKGEVADILMQAGSDIGFVNKDGHKVLSQINNSDVFNSIVFFKTLSQVSNRDNWVLLKEHLQESEESRDKLSPINKYLLQTFLPDGDLKNMIAPQEILLPPGELNKLSQTNQNLLFLSLPEGEMKSELDSLIEKPSNRSDKLNKLLEIKQNLTERLIKSKEPNPELVANSFVIDLSLKPKKIEEIANVNTVIAGLYPTKGHDSILTKAFDEKIKEDLPDLVAANIQSFLNENKNISKDGNFHANAALQEILNTSPQATAITPLKEESKEHDMT